MTDNQPNSTADSKAAISVAIWVDREDLRNYSVCLRHLFVGLAEQGCRVVLICPGDAGSEHVLCPSVELIGHPMFKIPLFWLYNRRALLSQLGKFKPTVLHCFSVSKARPTRWLAHQMDVPYVLTFNSCRGKLIRPPVSTHNCASLIGSSKVITARLNTVYAHFADRIAQINIGTFTESTCACFSDPRCIPTLVVAQRLDNSFDFASLLNAVKHLAIDGYKFVLAIIGRGRAERELREMVKALGLSQIVTVVPRMEPMRAVFADADIFVRLQPEAGFSSILLEAMSVGMAVASCQTSTDELLIGDKTAVFFDPHDELSIYSCLQRLLGQREFARKIALGGQEYLKTHHTVSEMVDRLLETYSAAKRWYKGSGQ